MKTTLWNILNNSMESLDMHRGIEIPMIQRDYAQGRRNAKANEIREVFLADLHERILGVKEGLCSALDLDFVYGTDDNNAFIPLDGQQRLTTLYLIHWYLAFKEDKIGHYRTPLSKFSYQTRPSSALFIKRLLDGLEQSDHDDIFKRSKSFEEIIKDKNWYFVSWNHDLTVQAILVMLDNIHKVFQHANIVLEDVINSENPPVTFNFLHLTNFGLSDNLYVKMNSRGKPLTSFENLKAELGKFLKESTFNDEYAYVLDGASHRKNVDVETYFMTKIDNQWTDLFWGFRDERNLFDGKLLNLLSFTSFNVLARQDRHAFNQAMENFTAGDFQISFHSLYKNGLITEESIISYIDYLDLLANKTGVFAEFLSDSGFYQDTVLKAISKKLDAEYEVRVLIYGIFAYARKLGPSLSAEELHKWSRLLHNLARNTIYNQSRDFIASLQGIDEFLDRYQGDVYKDFSELPMSGFDTVQTKEEKIKLILRLKYHPFNALIDTIENHGYLEGQITGLLVLSGLSRAYDADAYKQYDHDKFESMRTALAENFSKFTMFFSNGGLTTFPDQIFRRALLTFGDYSIYSTNFCFFNNKHRDVSWKRLLKELDSPSDNYRTAQAAFLSIFDRSNLQLSPEMNLTTMIDEYIANHTGKCDWLFYFVKYPSILLSAQQNYVKFFENGDIYPLRKTKYFYNEDPDYMTLILLEELKNRGINTTKIETGYIQGKIKQFGIKSIKNKSLKVVYNHDNNRKFFVKESSQDGFFLEDIASTVDHIESQYFKV